MTGGPQMPRLAPEAAGATCAHLSPPPHIEACWLPQLEGCVTRKGSHLLIYFSTLLSANNVPGSWVQVALRADATKQLCELATVLWVLMSPLYEWALKIAPTHSDP